MKKTKYIIYIGIFALLLFYSCENSLDGETLVQPNESTDCAKNYTNKNNNKNAPYSAWGFVVVKENNLYIKTDSDKLLKTDILPYSFYTKEGDRVYVNFSLVKQKKKSQNYDYKIKTNKLLVVAWDKIKEGKLEATNKNNKRHIKIKGATISSNYLNLSLLFHNVDNKKQKLELYYDKSEQKENAPIYLTLVNTTENTNSTNQEVEQLYSFDISKIEDWKEPDNEGKIDFVILLNKGTEWEKQHEFTYEP